MALQKSYTDASGVTHSEAYHKIVELKVQKHNTADKVIKIVVSIYHDKAARDASKLALDGDKVVGYSVRGAYYDTYFAPAVLDLANHNPMSQAYAFLKELIDVADDTGRLITVNGTANYYNDAQDVLE